MAVQKLLISPAPFTWTQRKVALGVLPSNEEISGSDPSADFIDTVRRFGLLQPPMIGFRNNVWEIIFGRRRIKAARAAGLPHITCLVVQGDWWNYRDDIALIENEQRATNLAAELEMIESMVAKGMGISEIKEHTGMPVVAIRERLGYLRLIPPLREALASSKMGRGAAKRAAQLSEHDQRDLAQKLASEGRVRGADVSDLKAAKQVPVQLEAFSFSEPSWRDAVRAKIAEALDLAPLDSDIYATLVDLYRRLE